MTKVTQTLLLIDTASAETHSAGETGSMSLLGIDASLLSPFLRPCLTTLHLRHQSESFTNFSKVIDVPPAGVAHGTEPPEVSPLLPLFGQELNGCFVVIRQICSIKRFSLPRPRNMCVAMVTNVDPPMSIFGKAVVSEHRRPALRWVGQGASCPRHSVRHLHVSPAIPDFIGRVSKSRDDSRTAAFRRTGCGR